MTIYGHKCSHWKIGGIKDQILGIFYCNINFPFTFEICLQVENETKHFLHFYNPESHSDSSEEYVKNTLEKSKTEFELVSNLSKVISQQWIDYRVTMIWWDQNWFHRGINCFLNTMCIKQVGSPHKNLRHCLQKQINGY